jgi:hypothetical protein
MRYFYLFIVSTYIFFRAKLFLNKEDNVVTIAPVRKNVISHHLEILVGAQTTGLGGTCYVIYDLNNRLNLPDVSLPKNSSSFRAWLLKTYHKSLFSILQFKVVPIEKSDETKLAPKTEADFTAHVNSTLRRLRFSGQVSEEQYSHYSELLLEDCTSVFHSSVKSLPHADVLFFSHGIYALWGPILDAARNYDVEMFLHGSLPYHGNGFHLTKGVFQTSLPIDVGNSPIHESVAAKRIENRLRLATADQQTFRVTKSDSVELEKIKDFCRRFERAIVFFPNCLWDGNIDERDTIFGGLVDCINNTIECAPSSIGIVIRLHPAEATLWKEFEPLRKHIRSGNNVLVVDANADVISHEIAKSVDASVVYDGIMALELAYAGSSVIVPSRSSYITCPGLIVPQTKDDYWNAIKFTRQAQEPIDLVRPAVSQWLAKNFLTTKVDFSGYVPDGTPVTSNILRVVSDMQSFENFYNFLIKR